MNGKLNVPFLHVVEKSLTHLELLDLRLISLKFSWWNRISQLVPVFTEGRHRAVLQTVSGRNTSSVKILQHSKDHTAFFNSEEEKSVGRKEWAVTHGVIFTPFSRSPSPYPASTPTVTRPWTSKRLCSLKSCCQRNLERALIKRLLDTWISEVGVVAHQVVAMRPVVHCLVNM